MFDQPLVFTATQYKNAKKLMTLADKKLQSMEYGTVTIQKVKNLSHSDVEAISDAMSVLLVTGQNPYFGRLSPSNELKDVYINAGVFSN